MRVAHAGPGTEENVFAAGDEDQGLTDLEGQINANVAFRQFKNLGTSVHSCRGCERMMLAFITPIHCHKSHSVHAESYNPTARE